MITLEFAARSTPSMPIRRTIDHVLRVVAGRRIAQAEGAEREVLQRGAGADIG
jgi:hypothetical protein